MSHPLFTESHSYVLIHFLIRSRSKSPPVPKGAGGFPDLDRAALMAQGAGSASHEQGRALAGELSS